MRLTLVRDLELSSPASRLVAVLLASLALLLPHLLFFGGWIPHDDGLLAMSALRVLHGELPHLDFQDVYSGGLSALHALVFRVLGESIGNLRSFHLVVFHVFQLLALGAFQRSLRSWPLSALALLTLTAWTAPVYPASMPSWYVAYLGFLALTLLAGPDEQGPRPMRLGAVGVLVGLAFSIKLTGIFLLPAVALGLWAHGEAPASATRPSIASRFVGFALLSWLPALVLVHRNLSVSHVLFFLAPLLLLALAASFRGATLRLRAVTSQAATLSAGFALGCAPLLAWCASEPGGLSAFVRGVFIEPSLRISLAAMPPPRMPEAVLTLAALIVLGGLLLRAEAKWRFAPFVLAAAWIALGDLKPVHRFLWTSLRFVPLLVAACLVFGVLQKRPWAARREIWLLATFAAFMNLTQFPYAFGIYVLYCMPFFLPTLVAAAAEPPPPKSQASRSLRLAALLGGMLGFALLWVDTTDFRVLGVAHRPRDPGVESDIERLGIAIHPDSVAHWRQLIAAIHEHSRAGDAILAFPDTPETYFLSNRVNPVRWPYDFFSPLGSYVDYLGIAEQHRVPMLVINLRPEFSRPPSTAELRRLYAAFPHVLRLDTTLLMWRDHGEAAP